MTINILSLNSFSVYAEYFIGTSIIYVLILSILVINNIPGLFIQSAISEAFAIILLTSCFIILNENQFFFTVINQQSTNELFYSLNTNIFYDDISAISKFILCFVSFTYFIIISEFFKNSILTFELIILLFFTKRPRSISSRKTQAKLRVDITVSVISTLAVKNNTMDEIKATIFARK